MKRSSFVLAVALLLASPASGARRAMLTSSEVQRDVLRAQAGTNPVSRVVELLNHLAKEIEKDGHDEEALYKKFVCWATTIIDSKSASNEAAQSRIKELEAYIEDINNNKIDFTTEQADLEKEKAELEASLSAGREQRAQENRDFLAAEDELQAGIDALEDAIKVLSEATEEKKSSAFLDVARSVSERAKASQALTRALTIADSVLDKADSEFLHRLMSGDVPRADWKTLNRKATFKSKYKARSTRIQSILADMLETFTENIAEARANENATAAEFAKLDKNKDEQLQRCKQALLDLEKETAARENAKQESQEEIDNLNTQVTNDNKFIEQTKTSLADKKEEWRERSRLRAGELASISKAISILHNDDARDMFKKSFDSQGYMFLQRASTRQNDVQRRAIAAIKEVSTKDTRVANIMKLIKDHAEFTEVLQAIDSMVEGLRQEEQNDLDTKDKCEKDRMDATRAALVAARTMDEKTENIEDLKTKIAANIEEIEKAELTMARVDKDKEDATEQRSKEKEEFDEAKALDTEAADTVSRAVAVLEEFYKTEGLNLIQKQPAGEAPPPPPPTWEEPYGGKQDEHQGIVAILGMIEEDIRKDISTAEAAEQKAITEFDSLISDLDKEFDAAKKMKEDLTQENDGMTNTIKDDKQARSNQNAEMDSQKSLLDGMREGCDYFLINYITRRDNRHIEIDGLLKAKAILEGGRFSAPEDPNRELKPGDA